MPYPASLPPPAVLKACRERLGGIGMMLKRGIGSWHGRGQQTALQIRAFWRVNALLKRVAEILWLMSEGRLPRTYRPRPRKPIAPAAAEQPTPGPAPPPPLRLPRKPGWLIGRHSDINCAAVGLRDWLADPAVVAAVEQIPQLRAPLRALCRMLLIVPSPAHPSSGDFPPDPPRRSKPGRAEVGPRKPRRVAWWDDADGPRPPSRAALLRQLLPGYRLSVKACR